MAILTLAQIKEELGFTDDLGTADDDLLTRKIAAAQDHVERVLGYQIEATFGGEDQDPIPPALIEAVSQIAAAWYEARDESEDKLPLPFGVAAVLDGYREFTF